MKNIDLNLQPHQKLFKTDLEKMIELLTADTPNGKKISIMLEEINFFNTKSLKLISLKMNSLNQSLEKLAHLVKFQLLLTIKTKKVFSSLVRF